MEYTKIHKAILATLSSIFIVCAIVILIIAQWDAKIVLASTGLFLLGAQSLYAIIFNKVSWLNKIGPLP